MKAKKHSTRRDFIKTTGFVGVALSALSGAAINAVAAAEHAAQPASLDAPLMPAPDRDGGIIKTARSPYCKLKSVDLSSVRWTNGFWVERFNQCREVTLPALYELMADPQRGHALTNLRIAAGLEKGDFIGTNWQDEWAYKWIESASYIYGVTRARAAMCLTCCCRCRCDFSKVIHASKRRATKSPSGAAPCSTALSQRTCRKG